MKILFVAISGSIHTARWINQVSNLGWDIRLFDCIDDTGYINPELRNATVYHSIYSPQTGLDPSVKLQGLRLPIGNSRIKRWLLKRQPNYRDRRLARLIQQFQPDIIYSLEFQHSSYMVLEARQWLKNQGVTHFPKWIVFNWGSDIYLFNRMADHKQRIYELLQQADYYECECQRDVHIAQELGMKAIPLPIAPVAGGIDLQLATQLRLVEKPSARRIIAMKGYQNWAGRALFGLRALELCADVLQSYKVVMFSAVPFDDMQIAATLFSQKTGIPIEIVPGGQPHSAILELLASARLYIGLSISDGISTSMLDAISVGAFPIQSNTACADEWVTDGETGMLVPPEDPQAIAAAIRRALTNDALVDQAAERNAKVCEDHLDARKIREQVIDMYTTIAKQHQS